jgi:hypothetical protein
MLLDEWRDLLIRAAETRDLSAVVHNLKKNDGVNPPGHIEEAILFAITNQEASLLETLLKNGTNPNTTTDTNGGKTAL